MKKRNYTVVGRTNDKGQLMLANIQEMNEFFKQWKNKRFVGQFHVYDPGSSEALKGYWFHKVVPDVRHALWEQGQRKTEEDTERYLRELSPVMNREFINEKTGKYESSLLTVPELDNQQLVFLIEDIKQIAAERFDLFIDDPKTIIK